MVGAAVLLHETRGTTFFLDEWNWIFNRRGRGIGTFLRPHNEHLSLVPVIVYKLLFASVGLRDYLPYRAVVIAAHLLYVTLMFVYARRRVGGYLALLAAAFIRWPWRVPEIAMRMLNNLVGTYQRRGDLRAAIRAPSCASRFRPKRRCATPTRWNCAPRNRDLTDFATPSYEQRDTPSRA